MNRLYCWCNDKCVNPEWHLYYSWSWFILCRPCRGFLRWRGGPPKGNRQVELQRPHGQDWSCRHRGNSWYDEDHEHFIMDSHTASVLDVKNVCMFAGELFKEMTVDYERATSEERLDEVRVSDSECISTNTTLTSLLWCRTMSEMNIEEPSTENALQDPGASVKLDFILINTVICIRFLQL